MTTSTLTRPAAAAPCPPWCTECLRFPNVDPGDTFHAGTVARTDVFAVILNRYDDAGSPGRVDVFVRCNTDLDPAQCRTLAAALVVAADLAEQVTAEVAR